MPAASVVIMRRGARVSWAMWLVISWSPRFSSSVTRSVSRVWRSSASQSTSREARWKAFYQRRKIDHFKEVPGSQRMRLRLTDHPEPMI